MVHKILVPIKPEGYSSITLTEGRNSVEHAIFDAMRQRGGDSSFVAMGFEGSHHGNSLVLTQFAHPKMSLDLGWPSIAFPTSQAHEAEALEKARAAINEKRAAGHPVAAVVIEPTNWQTGPIASDNFINQLREVAHDAEAALIVDETSTGCGASGKGFFQYSGAADYITFGKRTQVTGYFSKGEAGRPDCHLGGNQLDLLNFAIIHENIVKDDLINQVDRVGKSMSS